jgi:tellurium resistance protein TerZ
MSISLTKGQAISLSKPGSATLTKVFMGLGWDAKQPERSSGFFSFLQSSSPVSIDLDASCLMFDGNNLIDTVWFCKLRSSDRSISHSGDNLTGEGDDDDEVIHVDLSLVPSNVSTLLFTVNSFRGQTFNEVEGAVCRLVNSLTGEELARYEISGSGSHTGMFMASLKRAGSGWLMTALGEPTNGQTAVDMAKNASRFL